MKNDKYLSISAITKYLKIKMDQDEHLRIVFLKGEISNFKAHTTGHFYFSLKDETSKINAIMFQTHTKSLPFIPKDGMKVLVMGRISVYEATGNYQIYVEELLEDGVGNLYLAFEQLKEKLSKEGLFDSLHKQAIPQIPARIGVITASTGAAVKDIISTTKRRFPIAEILLFPTLVQGEHAATDIVRQLNRVSTFDLDVVILGRGGGSIEDLWPFNEESVARAIYACKVPVISAVGHEIDYTISDFVADLRAPTPTSAAELAVPSSIELKNRLKQYMIHSTDMINRIINYQSLYLDSVKNSFVIKNPMMMYENKKQKLDFCLEKVSRHLNECITKSKNKLQHYQQHHILINPQILFQNKKILMTHILEKLQLLNPLHLLEKGYSLTYHSGHVLKTVEQVNINDEIEIKLYRGSILAQITERKEETYGDERTKI